MLGRAGWFSHLGDASWKVPHKQSAGPEQLCPLEPLAGQCLGLYPGPTGHQLHPRLPPSHGHLWGEPAGGGCALRARSVLPSLWSSPCSTGLPGPAVCSGHAAGAQAPEPVAQSARCTGRGPGRGCQPSGGQRRAPGLEGCQGRPAGSGVTWKRKRHQRGTPAHTAAVLPTISGILNLQGAGQGSPQGSLRFAPPTISGGG